MTAPYLLDQTHVTAFPDVELALREPDGLLALGGDLSQERLLAAYQQGIFPWYSEGQPILWWSPDPRMVLFPQDIKISRSLNKTLRKQIFDCTFDQQFEQVIIECSRPRLEKGKLQTETWILDDMIDAYVKLHHAGYAHSVECWHDNKLVGGLYGVAIGKIFFGESMFSRKNDASKVALVFLAQSLQQAGYQLIDCQVYTSHLASMGAILIPRKEFIQLASKYSAITTPEKWPIKHAR